MYTHTIRDVNMAHVYKVIRKAKGENYFFYTNIKQQRVLSLTCNFKFIKRNYIIPILTCSSHFYLII